MEIYLIRHGKTKWNQEKRMQGQQDSPLIPEGIEQLQALGACLKDREFHGIYCSPLGRTMETANIVFPQSKASPHPGLKEIALGDWEGRVYEYSRGSVEPQEDFWESPHLFKARPMGGEDFYQVKSRALKALQSIALTHEDHHRIALVSHSVVIKCILGHFMNVSMESFWKEPVIYPSSLSVLQYNRSGKGKVLKAGDCTHYDLHPSGVI